MHINKFYLFLTIRKFFKITHYLLFMELKDLLLFNPKTDKLTFNSSQSQFRLLLIFQIQSIQYTLIIKILFFVIEY